MPKTIVKQLLAFFDYELRKRSRYFVDAFEDQGKLLKQQNIQVIFDCGANVGQTTDKYRKLFPNATIYSFEPTQETFNILDERFKNCDLVKPQRLAVSNVTENKQFFVYKDSQLNSFSSINSPSDEYFLASADSVQYSDVTSVTMDQFCIDNKIDKINILKMDIQGAELLALKGVVSLLKKQAVDLIYLEILFGKFYDSQGNFYEINKFLQEEYGYILYGVYNLTRLTDGTLGYGDAIFIKSDMRNQLSPYL